MAAMPPALVTLLPLKAVVLLLPGAETQPHALHQDEVCPGLLLGSAERLVIGGLHLSVVLVGVLGCGAPGSRLHLPQTGEHVFG